MFREFFSGIEVWQMALGLVGAITLFALVFFGAMARSTIGLTIRREGHEALVTKDFISTNLSAEFYIRVEPNEDDVKKAARTIGIDEGHASTDAVRSKSQQLLEPKLIGAIRAVAAQNDFLALHLNREHFGQEVSNALREDLGRN